MRAGNSPGSASRMPMTATTITISMSVKPLTCLPCIGPLLVVLLIAGKSELSGEHRYAKGVPRCKAWSVRHAALRGFARRVRGLVAKWRANENERRQIRATPKRRRLATPLTLSARAAARARPIDEEAHRHEGAVGKVGVLPTRFLVVLH